VAGGTSEQVEAQAQEDVALTLKDLKSGGLGFRRRGEFPLDLVQAAKEGRELAAAAQTAMMRQAALSRLGRQTNQLRRELETAARYMDEGAAILAELAAM
jgi:hypothetical protein